MSRFVAWIQLVRAPATPTAASNILMGYFIANDHWSPWAPLIALIVASMAFYSAGMVLNDVADFDEDRRLRPRRPLPSGRISLRAAKTGGWVLLAGGSIAALVAAVIANWNTADAVGWRCVPTAFILAGAIVAYDFGLKGTWVGPVLMGVCRSLNVLLGMSTGAASQGVCGFSTGQWSIALGVGVYVMGVSVLAKREAEITSRAAIIAAAVIMAVAIVWLGLLGRWFDPMAAAMTAGAKRQIVLLFGFISLPIVFRVAAALQRPSPSTIQTAVVTSLFSMIVIDAILCFGADPTSPGYSLTIAGLLVPSLVLSRWAKAT